VQFISCLFACRLNSGTTSFETFANTKCVIRIQTDINSKRNNTKQSNQPNAVDVSVAWKTERIAVQSNQPNAADVSVAWKTERIAVQLHDVAADKHADSTGDTL